MGSTAGAERYSDLLREGERMLGAVGVPTARLDAEVLLATAAGIDRTGLLARLRDRPARGAEDRFRTMIDRRRRREPVAYVTGVREFWSLPIEVTPAVLIPRPETELLVETARELLASRPAPLVCDAGTGSGCVAVALARELPSARLVAIDASRDALEVARRNATRLGVGDRVAFACADWLDAIGRTAGFDAIVSNPPYLVDELASQTAPELNFEPRAALAAGTDGLDAVRQLLRQAPARLCPEGWIVLEFGFGQAAAVRERAAGAGFVEISVRDDLAGIPRVLVARAPASR